MGLQYSSIVDAPRDEVWAWFGRQGALQRLTPPWAPLRPISQTASLEQGQTLLRLPGGLRWAAEHDPAGYQEPHQFVDTIGVAGLRSLPARVAVLRWRHTHRFEAVDDARTRVIDQIDSLVPGFALQRMFEYRHAQLAADLRAHQMARSGGAESMTIAVTGSSGLVGTALAAFLSTGGHRVVRLVRGAPRNRDERRWDPADPAPDLLDGVDAVVHLAGESIAGRFTMAHKAAVRDSRIEPTRKLAELAGRNRLRAFVCASAIGYYGSDRGDELLTEDSDRGDGFLADVVGDWEAAADAARAAGVRTVSVRTGIVQSPLGGTLRLLLPPFRAGLGGRLGDGRQWLSWIGIDDLVDVYYRALWDADLSGPVNAVAPEPVRNLEYTRALARRLHRPAVLPVPSLGPRLILGKEGARELAYASQRVEPAQLIARGHRFRHPTIDIVFGHLLGSSA